MQRKHIKTLHDHIGKEVTIAGWIDNRRDHGKLIFLDIRDGTGSLQSIALPQQKSVHATAEKIRPEWVVEATGLVKKRPENMVNSESPLGDIELEITDMAVLAQAKELPFDKDADLNIDTYLDNLPLTLRSQKARDIFTLQSTIIETFRESLRTQGFIEFQAPTLVGADAEGGAAAFSVNYYYDKTAYLATSPQLYKQIMTGVYERVFATPKIFRAEKHSTTRHLPEYTSMDFEMGFIKDHTDVMKVLEHVMSSIISHAREKPLLPKSIPTMTLREAQRTLGVREEPDLEPEHERELCKWAVDKHNSDFVFVTHYPVEKRPFYTYEDENDPGYTKSFDLLFRGLEITTGGQRIHDHALLVEKIKERGLDPEAFAYYLQAFKYGMPPHGGCATGLERITARILNLENVREATLFPRDLNRIDTLLSE